jgi:NAD(P)-dependent dehydrogenase (short-subunit alcohol dehydrogenase family)
MRRIVVIGGRGFFGAAAAALLHREGVSTLVTSRRPGDSLRADAEDPASLRAVLQSRDVVIDAAGPFHRRSTVLVETCVAIGCDVIDLSESFDYTSKVQALGHLVASSGIRVLPACSSASAVSAALVRLSGVQAPVRASTFLAPATKHTSTAATTKVLLSMLDRPVRVVHDGTLVERPAFSQARAFAFPAPVGRVSARLAESADVLTLPRIWPTLRDVDFWIDTRSRVLNALLAKTPTSERVRSLLRSAQRVGRRMTKRFGSRSGGFGLEIEDATGARRSLGFVHDAHSFIVAVAPAVLAARRIASGTFAGSESSGVVPVDRQVDPRELVEYLRGVGIKDFGIDPRT